jgi:hypothetical protein
MGRRWRAGLVFVVLMAAALTLPAAAPAGSVGLPPAPPGTRAMWLWSDAPADEVIAFAVRRGVSEVFVSVSPAVATDGSLPRLRRMRELAGAAGIRLSALGGDPSWATDHAAALRWQRAVVATGLFAGLHVDVEPYALPGWTTAYQATAKGYLAVLDKLRTGSPLPVEADVPFWYGQYRVGGQNLANEVLKRVAAITVMSYRDTGVGPNSILDVSRDWLVRGSASGKRVRLGAETGALPDCGYCTFAEEGATRLGNELAEVDAATRSTYSFAGIAIHHYDSWRDLPA